jgi:hypothetical protein
MSNQDETMIPIGTLRLIVQEPPRGKAIGRLLGFALLPLPDGANPGDCIEVQLMEDGAAMWKVVKPGVLAKGHPNRIEADLGRDHSDRGVDVLLSSGIAARACFPEEPK